MRAAIKKNRSAIMAGEFHPRFRSAKHDKDNLSGNPNQNSTNKRTKHALSVMHC